MADRIQLSRAKGWRMPPNTVKVDRSTIWGNPFTRAAAREAGYTGTDDGLDAFNVSAFAGWLGGNLNRLWWTGAEADQRRAAILTRLPELRGKNLACWCKPGCGCHAEVLLHFANAPHPETGWLIHKHNRGWYRPDAAGYTLTTADAGRYTLTDALDHSHPNGPLGPRDGMVIRHESWLPHA